MGRKNINMLKRGTDVSGSTIKRKISQGIVLRIVPCERGGIIHMNEEELQEKGKKNALQTQGNARKCTGG